MKLLISFTTFIFISLSLFAQETTPDSLITGIWLGKLNVMGKTLRVVVHVNYNDGNYSATLDSPDQSAKDIPISQFKLTGDSVMIKVDVASASYDGILNRDSLLIDGNWKQAGQVFPIVLNKIYNPELIKP